MRRREFIAGLGGAAAWPLTARAEQGEPVRRIGVLSTLDENDPLAKSLLSALTRALADLGWTDGRNARIDLRRLTDDDRNRTGAVARELVVLQPDIIVTAGTAQTAAFQRETRRSALPFRRTWSCVPTR
jgi:putative tryptophan/tyrosine transport system substrate-binding protein